MDRELEVAAAASAGGWLRWKKRHANVPLGTPCANCETALQGPYCHACGQFAENFHRSIGHLILEAVESFFHYDGRFWRTLPRLVREPGKLTRDYLDGKRAFQIPPLRMFLVVLLLVFLLGGLGGHKPPSRVMMVDQKTGQTQMVEMSPQKAGDLVRKNFTIDAGESKANVAAASWIRERVIHAVENPEQFILAMETWAHRLAVLLLPIGALLLSVLFVFQRQFYVYDHLIFTMHSLSFQGLLLSLYFLIALVSDGLAWMVVMLAAPTHLFIHMRGAYRTSVPGTLVRMFLLFIASTAVFFILLGALIWLGLSAMGGAGH